MIQWPKEFLEGITEFPSRSKEEILGLQLVAWGNVMFGVEPPIMFYEVMDAASKITGCFTSTECMDAADHIQYELRQKWKSKNSY